MISAFPLLVLALMASPPPAVHSAGSVHAAVAASTAAIPLDRDGYHDAMRKLWEDHVTWTRLYIVSAIAGLPDTQPAAERLLRNQVDIGDAIKPFYGEAAGDALTALLRPHILIAAETVDAAIAGDTARVEDALARWYANADEIGDFLAAANPDNWSREAMRAEMRHHLDLTLEEALARLRGDWAADIAAYDTVHEHILGMADVLSSGIIRQFPRKFRS
ncbi:MAG TPA: hypothetical protein VLG15_01330 [Thermoanaerobaculia bacterium]|jgi:hypothetical protein|nr:hypothetical protein [Thermoanaerobaculia bacterium]